MLLTEIYYLLFEFDTTFNPINCESFWQIKQADDLPFFNVNNATI